jgi:CheY-like chemotaxis protein
MPKLDGYLAAKEIKTFAPQMIIIAQTAYALDYEVEKYNDIQFDEYVTKPIIKQELVKIIQNYFNI